MADVLRTLLRAAAARAPRVPPLPQDSRSDEEQFRAEYVALSDRGAGAASCPVIPPFHRALPAEEDTMQQKLREEARAQFLQRRSKLLLDNPELKELWVVLDSHTAGPPVGEEQMMDFNQFQQVRALVSPKCQAYFRASVFAKLQQGDRLGRVSIMALFNYVMRKVWLHQTRIGLSLYDVTGQGFLRECDLENYILELIETLSQLDDLEKSFHSFYVCTAVRKFFFFLDPMRTGKIRIQDVLACSFLDDLLELRDTELPKDLQVKTWRLEEGDVC